MFKSKENNVIVYLVDDDELHLKILKNKFETTTKYKLFTFTSGEDFMEHIIKNPSSTRYNYILVLDYLLSSNGNGDKKNGVEILKIIKEINPDIDVIMLSGKGDIETAISSMHHGAVTFIEKSENSFIRINNNIKWIISEKNIERKKKDSMITMKIFFGLLFLILAVAGVIYLFYPDMFNF